MIYKPYQSCLIPYENEIIALRRKKPPMPYSQIAELLRDKYQITICRENIFRFVKIRSKGIKACKYAWNIEPQDMNINDKQPAVNAPSLQTSKATVSDKSKKSVNKQPELFKYEYSREYNMRRLSPEEAAAERKKIEEEEKEKQ